MPFRTPPPTTMKFPRALSSALIAVLAFVFQNTSTPALAQAQTATAQTSAAVSIRGTVADPDDAEIPGAAITLTPASGRAITGTSQSDGTYSIRAVPGTYSLTITMPGFATFVRQGIRITAAAPVTINAKLAIQNAEQTVNVTATQATVSVDQDSNASATVLTGKDLDALSDDPDELSDELSALAGPSAGPNGGQIYIDGFTGGQLPPKSSIREIRINQNPFSAQYDRAGFGRVEIFTKPGTDKFHGNAQINGQDKAFNTGSPFIGNNAQPGYHSILSFGSISGPLSKGASFTVGGSYRQIQSNSIVDPPAILSTSQTAGTFCYPFTPGCTVYQTSAGNGFALAQFQPQTRWDISPRVDLALGEKNTLTVRFQSTHNTQQNQGIVNYTLPSAGYNSSAAETTIQVSDTQIVSSKIINEIHFEYQRPTSNETPFSTAPYINVQGAFNGGGSPSGLSNDVQNHIEFQNYTSVALAHHFIRFGGRLRTTSDTNTTTSGSNGTFSYSSISNYVAGVLADYSVNQIPVPTVSARMTDVGVYAEDDWKVRPNWTFSYGLRYETQNFLSDHKDFAPRISTAYGLGKKTVIRAGGGIFYDRFGLGNQLSILRNNGINQQQFTISSTVSGTTATSTIPTTCNPNTPAACPLAQSRLTEQVFTPNLRAPYSIQLNAGVDQQLARNATVSVNYQHIRGIHQFNSDVPNYLTASTTQPLLYQYQSEGVFNQNQLITNFNLRNFHGASFFGYYVLNFAKSDTGGLGSFASVPGNLSADYGRASFDVRNRVFIGGSYVLPHLISLSPLLVAQSGNPYNITTGTDLFHDNIFNGRAQYAALGTAGSKTIGGCGTFAAAPVSGTYTPVPINACTGPANFTMNLRVTKTFGFGEKANPRPDRQAQGGGNGPPGGGRGPGGPGGGGGRGGGGGFGGGGGASSGKKYNFALGAQGENIFNVVDRSTPVGTFTSPGFGSSINLAQGIYATNSAVRRISLQASFNF